LASLFYKTSLRR